LYYDTVLEIISGKSWKHGYLFYFQSATRCSIAKFAIINDKLFSFQMSNSDISQPIDVDLTRSSSGVWLVKMPKYLSNVLEEYGDGTLNGDIGRLIRRPQTTTTTTKTASSSATGGRQNEVIFSLNDQIMDRLREKNPSKDFKLPPREHQFCLTNISDGVLRTVYTRTTRPNSNNPFHEQIAVVGKVMQRAEVRPVENDEYMALKRKHFEASQEPTRKAEIIKKQVNAYQPRRDHEENRNRLKAKRQAGKRVRSDEDVVTNRIFSAFAKNQYISMGSLETITQQPKTYLHQLLKRYCNYNHTVRRFEFVVFAHSV